MRSSRDENGSEIFRYNGISARFMTTWKKQGLLESKKKIAGNHAFFRDN